MSYFIICCYVNISHLTGIFNVVLRYIFADEDRADDEKNGNSRNNRCVFCGIWMRKQNGYCRTRRSWGEPQQERVDMSIKPFNTNLSIPLSTESLDLKVPVLKGPRMLLIQLFNTSLPFRSFYT